MFVSTSTDPIYKGAISEMKVSGGSCGIFSLDHDKWILLKPLLKTVVLWDIFWFKWRMLACWIL